MSQLSEFGIVNITVISATSSHLFYVCMTEQSFIVSVCADLSIRQQCSVGWNMPTYC